MVVPVTDSLAAWVAAHAEVRPDAPVIAGPGDFRLTYREFFGRSGQVANTLRALGVRPGDRVAAAVPKSPDVLVLYLACLRFGAVFLPANPSYTDDELRYLVHDADPALVVCDSERMGVIEKQDTRALTIDDLMARSSDESEAFSGVPGPGDLAAILYTSGTTGRPKGAMLSHRNLAANAHALVDSWQFTPEDVLLHSLPVFHAHGLFVAVNTILVAGSSMRWLPRFDVDPVIEDLPWSTVFMGVPTYYTRLLGDDRLDAARTQHVRLFISGSAPLAASTHREFESRTGHAILERYGMTETLMLASNPVQGERRPGTVGFPLHDVSLRIAGGKPTGGIEVRGPGVFSGYWRRPELSETEFTADGWFRTGDLGTIDPDGYVHIVGRSKDLIITGGMNVYPKEVEDALNALPSVNESAVIGVEDRDFGEAVVAIVVVRPGTRLDAVVLRDAMRGRLAPYKVPKRVHVIDALPRNTMGKVEKAALRSRFSGNP